MDARRDEERHSTMDARMADTTPQSDNTCDEAEFDALAAAEREMPCPVCGHPMPDLKGGKDTICPVCGFKDSCCY
ncbi:MAG TPA: hypothetical protein VFU88_23020 [Ktedonobacterales bacterium]|nr:hypothetical protein [Ktedonobacterales bacterium]